MAVQKAIEWIGGADGYLRLLDQTRLPGELVYRDCRDVESVRTAIRELAVRGAPAIGVSAAYGLVLAIQRGDDFEHAVERLITSRPTAVNLAWAMERMSWHWQERKGPPAAWLLGEAHAIAAEDEAMCAAMGRHGA